uniref:Fibronectin type-III domain-containing protein n=1 Tax=Sander lucioperca TaxID=283035 RepID=A0A8C9YD19_SANLU
MLSDHTHSQSINTRAFITHYLKTLKTYITNCTVNIMEKHSNFKPCDTAQCCSVHQEEILVVGESFTATVWKGGNHIESKIINSINLIQIQNNIKPKTPTIVSVNESNGNFHVKWKQNVKESLRDNLAANVTYHKKGDVYAVVKPTTLDEFGYYEILGRNLDPSTTYAVSVKSYLDLSGKFSDSSEEWEFTTRKCHLFSLLLKTKWWDTVAKCPNPKLLIMHPGEQEVSCLVILTYLTHLSVFRSKESLRESSGSLQQSSGISTGSSGLSYANTEPNVIACVQDALLKALPNISPISHFITNSFTEVNQDSGLLSPSYNPCGVRADDMSSGSCGFENKTYSILIPSGPHQNLTDAEMLCDCAYHPSAGDVTCADQHAPACPLVNFPPVVLPLMPTDMSYQQSNADPGGFSYAEESSLSSVSSGTNTIASCDPVSRVEGVCESFDEAACGGTKLHGKTEGAIICDENPCYGCAPAGSHSFPPVDDGYQAFQNLVEQPDILFSEERSGEKEECLNRYPEESFTKMPQSFLSPVVQGVINNVQGGQCLSELERPFLSLIPAHQSMPLITDSGYQSV